MNSFSQPGRCLLPHLCGCTVTGDEKHSWLGEGKWINGSLGHPGLFSQPRSPRLSSIFPPSLRCWALDHFSFPSPLHSTQFCHPAKETNQRALSLSLHIFPLFHSAFLCLCPLIVWSATSCPPPIPWCHTSGAMAVGNWPGVKWTVSC